MAWRGESWAEIVERAATGRPRRRLVEREDPAELAARATPWGLMPYVEVLEDGLRLGGGLETVQLGFAHLYHLEPVDPWPSLAIGWVDRDAPCCTVLKPGEPDAADFARRVEEVVEACEARVPNVTSRGWLEVPFVPWERADELPGEGAERPSNRGYRTAPEPPDPIVARRTTEAGAAALWTWMWARIRPVPRRIEPKETVLTKRFVYVRTREGRTLRIDASALRTARRTADGDAIYVFGRNTELLLIRQGSCPLAAALNERVGTPE